MSELKSAFICNQNQARSQVLSAVFSKLFAPHIFLSFGLIARENTPLPMVVNSVFDYWRLNPAGRFARNMGLHQDEILELDLVIAVTTFIAEEVASMGFTGKILDLEREAVSLGIDLVDPQLMPARQCAFELAKYLKVAFSAFKKLKVVPDAQRIKALIPEQESSIGAALDLAAKSKKKDSTIVYADLVAPRIDLIFNHLGPATKYRFHENIFELQPSTTGSPSKLLAPAHSVMWPASAYLGSSWTRFLANIDSEEITLITPPLKNRSGMVAESYLAALSASEVQIVK